MELSPGHQIADLNRRGAGDGEDADRKSQNEEWQQADSLARAIQSSRGGDLEESGEIADGGVGRQRKQGDDAMQRSHALIKHCERQRPADKRDRRHGIHSQQQRAINPFPQGSAILAQQQRQTICRHGLVVALGPAHDLLDRAPATLREPPRNTPTDSGMRFSSHSARGDR